MHHNTGKNTQTLEQVFTSLSRAPLTLNLAKCDFGKATAIYLGIQVGQGQLRPVEAKISSIKDVPVPTTRKACCSFVGMVGYYGSFCRDFSTIVQPLTNLLSPKSDWKWTSECQMAFNSVKTLLCSAPGLAAPDLPQPFKLEVHASAVGVSVVILQEDADGVDNSVCYFSHKFNKYHYRYSTIEKEVLALLFALQYFEVYVGSSCGLH